MNDKVYALRLTAQAFDGFKRVHGKGQSARVQNALKNLSAMPYLGHAYEPANKHLAPRQPCRVLFAGNYGIYYTVDDEAAQVLVLAVFDQRSNPERLSL